MTAKAYEIRECENPSCGLRYPLILDHPFGNRCPRCLASTKLVLTRSLDPARFIPSEFPPEANPKNVGKACKKLEVLLDNLRSAWNVGAIFRTADGFAFDRIHLCGITPTPENKSVGKTALGAEVSIPWDYSRNGVKQALELKNEGNFLLALEQDQRAIPIGNLELPDQGQITIIVGNEVTGIDPGILDICNKVVFLPMFGDKRSFNVEVAFGIAAYELVSRFISK